MSCYSAEVIQVLPDKVQADILLKFYFDAVDPVYPMLHRQTFYADYEQFWSLGLQERNQTDGAFIALMFVMLVCIPEQRQFLLSCGTP